MTAPPRVVFAGTPAFAAQALAAIHAARFSVPLVLTQPDRPAGRGMKLQASPVKQFALEHGLPVLQPASLRKGEDAATALAVLREIFTARSNNDVMVVAAYGLILPLTVLELPPGGCLNIHASLLPRWRGAAPIQRAIEAGDAETGITLMQMDEGLDTGAMLLKGACAIEAHDTTASLHDKLAALGAEMVVRGLQQLSDLSPQTQPTVGVTYASKIEKHEAALDFSQPAEVLARRIRAFNPFPGASTELNGVTLKFWQAQVVKNSAAPFHPAAPGTVLAAHENGIDIACGNGVLRITELQRAGGKRLNAAQFLAGQNLSAGTRLTYAPHHIHS